nr:Chain A, C-C chemokine receptor type 5 [Homo sapiens]
QYQFWKNFQT